MEKLISHILNDILSGSFSTVCISQVVDKHVKNRSNTGLFLKCLFQMKICWHNKLHFLVSAPKINDYQIKI